MTTTSVKRTDRSARPAFRCSECGWSATKWVGRCGECQTWGSVLEDTGPGGGAPKTVATAPTRSTALPIDQIDVETARAQSTGVDELDRVLGGGIVPGAVVLLAGEPGVGKSTLLLDVAARAARSGRRVLYVTGEESAAQVRLRAGRIHALAPTLLLVSETDLATVLGHIEQQNPDLLVVDSVQTIASAQVDGTAGGVSQVREVSAAVIQAAKARDMPVVLIGHVTKDGSVAGPRTLEHLVDVVCQFEGDRHSRLRMLRATKNRYGPTDEVGCFDLSETGIVGLTDPSGLFISQALHPVPGTCLTVTLEGRRPLVAEVQSLVALSSVPNPRRTTSGVDSSRLAMVLAVLQRRLGRAARRPGRLRVDHRRRPRDRARRRPRARPGRGQLPGERAAAARTRRDRRGRAGRRDPDRVRGGPTPGRGRPARVHARDRARGRPGRDERRRPG